MDIRKYSKRWILCASLWDQDTNESRIDAPGNIYGQKQKIIIDQSLDIDLNLNQVIEDRVVVNHPLAKKINFKSDVLSKWWE